MGVAYLPLAAILDYELTLTKPFRLTADTGIDAICHAMVTLTLTLTPKPLIIQNFIYYNIGWEV